MAMQATTNTTFTNLQQELLLLYARQVSEEDLQNIKHLIGDYFAKRMTMMADVAWRENNWTQQDMEDILDEPNQ